MSSNSILILLGVLIVIVPFIGLPISVWRMLEVVLGACVLGIGLSLRAREARLGEKPAKQEPPAGVSPI